MIYDNTGGVLRHVTQIDLTIMHHSELGRLLYLCKQSRESKANVLGGDRGAGKVKASHCIM